MRISTQGCRAKRGAYPISPAFSVTSEARVSHVPRHGRKARIGDANRGRAPSFARSADELSRIEDLVLGLLCEADKCGGLWKPGSLMLALSETAKPHAVVCDCTGCSQMSFSSSSLISSDQYQTKYQTTSFRSSSSSKQSPVIVYQELDGSEEDKSRGQQLDDG